VGLAGERLHNAKILLETLYLWTIYIFSSTSKGSKEEFSLSFKKIIKSKTWKFEIVTT
jgi:hypothetical protein